MSNEKYFPISCIYSLKRNCYELSLSKNFASLEVDCVVDLSVEQAKEFATIILGKELNENESLKKELDLARYNAQQYDALLQKCEKQRDKLLNAICNLTSALKKEEDNE